MDVDIDDLYEKFHFWKKNIQEKDHYIHLLQEQLKVSREEKDSLQSMMKNLLEDMANTHKILVQLKDDMEKYKTYECEIEFLQREKETLLQKLEDQEKSYEKKLLDMTNQLTLLKTLNIKKVKDIEEEMISQKEQAALSMQEKIDQGYKRISELEQMVNRHEMEKKRFLHLQNEFEKKFLQMKDEISQATRTSQVPSFNEEIFRNKYENMKKVEAERREEIKHLEEEIKTLKQLNERLLMENKQENKVNCSQRNNLFSPGLNFNSNSLPHPLSGIMNTLKSNTPQNTTNTTSSKLVYKFSSSAKPLGAENSQNVEENKETHLKRRKCVNRKKLFSYDNNYLEN